MKAFVQVTPPLDLAVKATHCIPLVPPPLPRKYDRVCATHAVQRTSCSDKVQAIKQPSWQRCRECMRIIQATQFTKCNVCNFLAGSTENCTCSHGYEIYSRYAVGPPYEWVNPAVWRACHVCTQITLLLRCVDAIKHDPRMDWRSLQGNLHER